MEKEEKKTKYMVKLKAMLKVKTDAEKIKSELFMPLKTNSHLDLPSISQKNKLVYIFYGIK